MSISTLRTGAAAFVASLCFASQISSAQSYTALARAFADAPLVARIKVLSSQEIKPPPSPDKVRYYATASVTALVRAPSPQPPSLNLLADLPLDSRGKRPRINKSEWLIAARPIDGKVQLVAPPVAWTADNEARVRAIVAASTAADTPGSVRRISGAFYSPGNVPGESETQIFVDFTGGGKGSLSVLRRPGMAPAWHASFGEVANDGPPPARDTMSWYRLACGLPKTLPESALGDLDAAGRTATAADYAFVLAALGPCDA
jgi:hypothetical protein